MKGVEREGKRDREKDVPVTMETPEPATLKPPWLTSSPLVLTPTLLTVMPPMACTPPDKRLKVRGKVGKVVRSVRIYWE